MQWSSSTSFEVEASSPLVESYHLWRNEGRGGKYCCPPVTGRPSSCTRAIPPESRLWPSGPAQPGIHVSDLCPRGPSRSRPPLENVYHEKPGAARHSIGSTEGDWCRSGPVNRVPERRPLQLPPAPILERALWLLPLRRARDLGLHPCNRSFRSSSFCQSGGREGAERRLWLL